MATGAETTQIDRAPRLGTDDDRFAELDGLRGIAAGAVMLTHYANFCALVRQSPVVPFRVDAHWCVLLFFMISGYVILMTLERGRPLSSFAWSRFARLMPTFWACLAMTWVFVAWAELPTAPHGLKTALANVSLFHSFVGVRDVDEVYWTLRHEVCFYVAMGLLAAWGAMRHLRGLCWAWLIAATAYVQLERAGVLSAGHALTTVFQVHWGGMFVAGLMFYRLRRRRSGDEHHAGTHEHLLIVATLVSYLMQRPGLLMAGCMIGVYAAFYLTVYGKMRWLTWGPLLKLGGISYPLYLLHQNIGFVVIRKLEDIGVDCRVGMWAAVAFSLALATAMSYSVERPAQRWLTRLAGKRQSDPSAAPETLSPESSPELSPQPAPAR